MAELAQSFAERLGFFGTWGYFDGNVQVYGPAQEEFLNELALDKFLRSSLKLLNILDYLLKVQTMLSFELFKCI